MYRDLKIIFSKHFIIGLLSLLSVIESRSQSTIENLFVDNLNKGDTLYINFSIASGEMGSTHQGLLLYWRGGQLFGKFVLYNYGISFTNGIIEINPNTEPITLESSSLISFFNGIKAKYFVLQKDWILDSDQIKYLDFFFSKLLTYEPKGFSNAPEYYSIMSKAKTIVVIDSSGRLKAQVELKKNMKLI